MILSIISPVYKAELIVDELIRRIIVEAEKITTDFEIILVEDGSPDNCWGKILENCKKDSRVKGLKLSRNFGQHFAISAGLENSIGDFVIVMDCDLQDDPRYFGTLLAKANEGYKIVYTYKKERKHGFFKNLKAKLFYKLFNFLVDNKDNQASENVGSFSLLSREVVDQYVKLGDYKRHYLMLLRWLGFQSAYVEIEHQNRFEGKSSYNFKKLMLHAIDGITSQSDKLLRLTASFGFLMALFSLLSAIGIVISYLITPFQAGWASLMVLTLFVGGMIILSVGICGIYIGRIFEQTKKRPLYIVDQKINL
jgi:glycosyltransferase involved in cell wall biosynthesis